MKKAGFPCCFIGFLLILSGTAAYAAEGADVPATAAVSAFTLTVYVCAVIMLMGMVYEIVKRRRSSAIVSGVLMFLLAALGALSQASPVSNADVLASSGAINPTVTAEARIPLPTAEVSAEDVPAQEKSEWVLSFAGNCTVATLQKWQDTEAEYNMLYRIGTDYAYPFSNVKAYFENDDFTLVSCEGTFTDETEPVGEGLCFRAPPAYARVFALGGIDGVSLANEHTADYGAVGTQNTYEALEELNILWTDSAAPIVTALEDGPKLGIVSLNTVSADGETDTADGYAQRISPDIEACRAQGCDIIIACVHWGQEYSSGPEWWQISLSRKLAALGCDIVIGDHPYALQRAEVYNGVPVYYSLGNFCYGGNSNPSDKDAVIVQQTVLRDADGTYRVGEATYIPCRISTSNESNDFCPTPYAQGTEAYNRTLTKLNING